MDEQPVVPQPEATPTPAPDGKFYLPKQCRKCGESFQPTNARSPWCETCRPDKRTQKREQKAAQRKRAADRESADSKKIGSTVELKPKEAREILEARGIRNQHVVDFCVQLAEQAAKQLRSKGVYFNHYLLTHGLRATLAKTKLPEIADEIVDGEILYRRDLYCLWDFGFFRQPNVAFEQWLQNRFRFKNSTWELGQLLGKEDFGPTHREWEKFLVRFDPRGLRPGYTQREALDWLGEQRSDKEGDKRRFLLVCSRNAFKSTWVRILALQFSLCLPDSITLYVSETNRLSRKAMREFRGYLTLQPANPTLFQQYFGEYCVAPDDGSSLTYENPLAHLGLPQIAFESSSMESSNTGSRFMLCIADDPVSRDNGTANDEQKEAALAKYGSIARLREPKGIIINVQTPWAVGDLGQVMIQRNEEDPDRGLAVRIDPLFSIKPESADKKLLDLGPDDVVLNFLPKLDWKFTRTEMRSPEGIEFFKSQYLCQWPRPEEEGLTIQFTEADLRRATKVSGYFEGSPVLQTGLSIDRSFSANRYSDLAAAIAVQLRQLDGKMVLVVVDLRMDRWKDSEFVKNIADLVVQYSPSWLTVERGPGLDTFLDLLRREIMRRGVAVPFFRVIPVNNQPKAKFIRIKRLEGPLSAMKLMFRLGSYIDSLFAQMLRFDGSVAKKSTALQKEDAVDALGLAYESIRELRAPDEIPEDPEIAAARRELDEKEQKELLKRMQYDRVFGGGYASQPLKTSDFLNDAQRQQMGLPPRNGPEPEPEPARPADPRDRIFSYAKSVQPSNVRNQLFGVRGRWRGK